MNIIAYINQERKPIILKNKRKRRALSAPGCYILLYISAIIILHAYNNMITIIINKFNVYVPNAKIRYLYST